MSRELNKNAFVADALKGTNSELSCPAGVIKVRKGSCDNDDESSNGLTLSIPEIRRLAAADMQLSRDRQQVAARSTGFDLFEILQLRVTCYKQGKDRDMAGRPMETSKKQQPCGNLTGVNQTLTPLVGQSLLTATNEAFQRDASNIENQIIPQIEQRKVPVQREIDRLTPLVNAAAQRNDLALQRLRQAEAAKATPEYYMNQAYAYQSSTYNALVRCDIGCSDAQRATLTEQYYAAASAATSAYYAYKPYGDAYTAAVNTQRITQAEYDQLNNLLVHQQNIMTSYNNMIAYLRTITDGKNLLVSNSQLASIQGQGGVLANLLRQGNKGAARKAAAMLPDVNAPGVTSTQTTSPDADTINFGMIKMKPICFLDKNTKERKLKFLAKTVDMPPFKALGAIADFEDRKARIQSVLEGLGKKRADGWVRLPENFTPSNCTIKEEADPPLTGPNNWSQDGLVTKVN